MTTDGESPPERGAMGPAERVVAIIELFAQRPSWGVRELAATLSQSRSAVHRILQELTEVGLLGQHGDGPYEQAAGYVRFASLVGAGAARIRVAQPHLIRARDECGDTVVLTVYDATTSRYAAVAAAESQRPVRYVWDSLRAWRPMHDDAGAAGILAFLPPDEIDRVLTSLDASSTTQRKTALAAVRKRGYSRGPSSPDDGATAVSAPVRNHDREVIGGVMIVWPAFAAGAEQAKQRGSLCVEVADRISADLGLLRQRTHERNGYLSTR